MNFSPETGQQEKVQVKDARLKRSTFVDCLDCLRFLAQKVAAKRKERLHDRMAAWHQCSSTNLTDLNMCQSRNFHQTFSLNILRDEQCTFDHFGRVSVTYMIFCFRRC